MLTKILTLTLLFSSPCLLAKSESQRAVLARLFGQSKDKIKVAGCQKFQLNPREIFKAITYKTVFNSKCDFQGEVAIRLLSPFPLKMNIKNLKQFKAIEGTAQLNLGMDNPPKLLGELSKAKLVGGEPLYFNAFYSGEILPATTLKIKPGTEKIRIEIYDDKFSKKVEEFTLDLK